MTGPFSNLLIDLLPTSLTVCGAEKQINSDFRIALLFESLMDDPEISNEDKIIQAVELFFVDLPETKEELTESIEQLLWFYRCGKEPNEYMKRKVDKKKDSNVKEPRIYDINYDDDYIYAAFMQQYRINLNQIEYMHWWEFRALFKALTNETEFVKIMEYRGMDISKDLTPEQKAHYKKMKSIYALPRPKEEQERQRSIEEALMGNGDLSGIL